MYLAEMSHLDTSFNILLNELFYKFNLWLHINLIYFKLLQATVMKKTYSNIKII